MQLRWSVGTPTLGTGAGHFSELRGAAEWCQRAAARGDANAMTNLGVLFEAAVQAEVTHQVEATHQAAIAAATEEAAALRAAAGAAWKAVAAGVNAGRWRG